MVAEDLLFWIEPLDARHAGGSNVLCRRHADAMVVPRGWTLDDRRLGGGPRLFQPSRFTPASPATPTIGRQRARAAAVRVGEQLQLDGTGEIARPATMSPPATEPVAEPEPDPEPEAPWRPEFDVDDDLGGLLKVESPLLARAFRGTGRPRQR
jgi:hypothetical protein